MTRIHHPGFLALAEEARRQIAECSVADVRAMLERDEDFPLIDVREESEVACGRIPKALALGRGILERDIEGVIPDKAASIVLYCGGGYRSALAALNLKKMGYTHVHSLRGGFGAWTEAGLPIES